MQEPINIFYYLKRAQSSEVINLSHKSELINFFGKFASGMRLSNKIEAFSTFYQILSEEAHNEVKQLTQNNLFGCFIHAHGSTQIAWFSWYSSGDWC